MLVFVTVLCRHTFRRDVILYIVLWLPVFCKQGLKRKCIENHKKMYNQNKNDIYVLIWNMKRVK